MRFLPNALPRQRYTGKDGGDTANKAGSEIKRGEGVVPGLPALHDIKRESGKSRKAAAETRDTESPQGGVITGKRLCEIADKQAAEDVGTKRAGRKGARGQAEAEQVAREAAQPTAEEDENKVVRSHGKRDKGGSVMLGFMGG